MAALADQTFLVTGANTGIGRATVEALAKDGAGRIVLAARSRDKTQPVIDALAGAHPGVTLEFLSLDLADLSAVARSAAELLRRDEPIDVLIDNAGVAGLRGVTADGFELAFGTNHLGHFLFTETLLPLVERAPQGRIVIVSSRGHYRAKGIDYDAVRRPTATTSAFPEYCVSKLCNVLYAKELARRLAHTRVTTYSLHPGGVASDIWQRRLGWFANLLKPFLISNEQGALTQLRCATDPALAEETGLYYDAQRPVEPSLLAQDTALADELVAKSRAFTERWL